MYGINCPANLETRWSMTALRLPRSLDSRRQRTSQTSLGLSRAVVTSLRLQVYEHELPWGLKDSNKTYFGLSGAPGKEMATIAGAQQDLGNWWFDMQILLSEMQKSFSRCKVLHLG